MGFDEAYLADLGLQPAGDAVDVNGILVPTPHGLQYAFTEPSKGPPPHVASSESHEWYTPQHIIERAESVLGGIDVDPASPLPERWRDWVPAKIHYSKLENGLAQNWNGTVYLNPPYGRGDNGARPWVIKMYTEHELKRMKAGILLVPARTDTEWFRLVWRFNMLCFIYGRLKHISPEVERGKKGRNTATFPSVLAYLGPHKMAFGRAFSDIGYIIDPAVQRHWVDA